MRRKKAVVALSGGVDSSVAALLLLEAGFDVSAVHMQITPHIDSGRNEAELVSKKLGIPLHFYDLSDDFGKIVIRYFIDTYKSGCTPNPCIVCNRYIKFGLLFDYAMQTGADYFATGHYANLVSVNSIQHLYRAADLHKDQSYFLYKLKQERLSSILFPLGRIMHSQVKELAIKHDLPASTSSSQDICFIQGHLSEFISQYYIDQPGEVIGPDGNLIGQHTGIAKYTIGQRRGLGIPSGKPLYITAIEPETNRIIVGEKKALYKSQFHISNVEWIIPGYDRKTHICEVQIRYNSLPVTGKILIQENYAKVKLHKPLYSITPGQSAVFYTGKEVLGGGIIDR